MSNSEEFMSGIKNTRKRHPLTVRLQHRRGRFTTNCDNNKSRFLRFKQTSKGSNRIERSLKRPKYISASATNANKIQLISQTLENTSIKNNNIKNSDEKSQIPCSNSEFTSINNNNNQASELPSSFSYDLREWAVSNNVPLTTLKELLSILRKSGKHEDLPKDPRTLLETPTNRSSTTKNKIIHEIGNGKYIHFGIYTSLKQLIYKGVIGDTDDLLLSFCVDGTPTSDSGISSLWPILGAVHSPVQIFRRTVFIVGLFQGASKPSSFNEFLSEFVSELCSLLKNGFVVERQKYTIKVKCIIADAPALAYLKGCKSHGGYSSCTKCETRGTNIAGTNKIVFPQIDAPLRTDESYRKRKSSTDNDEHYTSLSPSVLESLPIDMIADFPLDKMHLVDEGVVKKILVSFTGKANPQKLPARSLRILNENIKICTKFMPMEFQRKTRSLQYVLKMKASEFRSFLLYVGPAVLANVIPLKVYNHFLTLSLAIRILSSPCYHLLYNDYAEKLLLYVVDQFSTLYGRDKVTYNVHGLIHLAYDVKRHGPLESYSCYAFESHIKVIKKMINAKNRPLEQIYNRVYEKSQLRNNNTERNTSMLNSDDKNNYYIYKEVKFSNMHSDNIYLTAKSENFTISSNKKSDNCIMLEDNTIIRIRHFEKINGQIFIVAASKFVDKIPLGNKASMDSFHMFTGKFEIDTGNSRYLYDNLLCKMCCLPYCKWQSTEDTYFVCPLIHQVIL